MKASGAGPRLLLLLASCLVAFGLAEGLLRALGYYGVKEGRVEKLRIVDDEILDFRHVPNESWIRDGRRNTINQHGWRDFDYSYSKPPDTFRIVALGDSVTHGYGLEVEEIWAKQLERLLSDRQASRYEVIMLTVGAINTRQEAHLLEVEGIRYDPDLIVVAYVLNDPERGPSLRRSRAQKTSPVVRLKKALSRSSLLHISYRAMQTLVWKTKQRLGREEVADYIHNDYFSRLHNDPKKWSNVLEGMDVVQAVREERDIPVIWMIFPVLHSFENYPWEGIHARVAMEAATRGFEALDLLPSYRPYRSGDLQVQAGDHVHPNRLGHEVAAGALLEFAEERELLTASSAGEAGNSNDGSAQPTQTEEASMGASDV